MVTVAALVVTRLGDVPVRLSNYAPVGGVKLPDGTIILHPDEWAHLKQRIDAQEKPCSQ